MAWTKAKTTAAIGVCVIMACGVGLKVLISRAIQYHKLEVHAYTRGHLDDSSYQEVLENLRARTWPRERKLEQEKIASGQQGAGPANAVTIDLRHYVNTTLMDSPASPAGYDGNNLNDLPAGVNVYGGIPFDVEGSIQLGGAALKSTFHKDYPAEMDGIAIRRRCAKIHLLHAADWMENPSDLGRTVARLVLHYEDGSVRQIVIVAGKDVGEFWMPLFTTGVDPRFLRLSPDTERAWTGSNPYVRQLYPDESLVLYRTTFANPQPDVAVSTLDYVSTMTRTAPFLVGLTVE